MTSRLLWDAGRVIKLPQDTSIQTVIHLESRIKYIKRLMLAKVYNEEELQYNLNKALGHLNIVLTILSNKHDPDDLWTHTIPQLRILARRYSIPNYSRMDKETLILEIILAKSAR